MNPRQRPGPIHLRANWSDLGQPNARIQLIRGHQTPATKMHNHLAQSARVDCRDISSVSRVHIDHHAGCGQPIPPALDKIMRSPQGRHHLSKPLCCLARVERCLDPRFAIGGIRRQAAKRQHLTTKSDGQAVQRCAD